MVPNQLWALNVNSYAQVDSLSILGVCVGGGTEPVDPAVEGGLVPGVEVEALPAWVEDELEAEVVPPSPALHRRGKQFSANWKST